VGTVVAAFGMPHSPHLPEAMRKEPSQPAAALYQRISEAIDAARPDVLVIFDCDHFSTMFLDNLPVFTVGVGERTAGPNDMTVMPRYEMSMHAALAQHLRAHGIGADFDLGLLQDFEVDHSIAVPLHFTTPRMHVPIVPVFMNCFVPPLPSSRRCYALGQTFRAAVESFPRPLRVAAVASGSFTLEIGGPKVAVGRRQGVPDPAWLHEASGYIRNGEVERLLAAATTARMLQAGNVAGELLTWIATWGMIGGGKPDWMHLDPPAGEVYSIWGSARP
jgi:protocatechuate 4,5-dioxygenase beta chain